MMEPLKYIAVEGPIGVGKTTLSRFLAEDFGARLILEASDDNPFLPAFYEDAEKNAFQAQVFFLLSRFRQQKELFQQDLFQQCTVSDYIFAKDAIFAQLNLTDDELQLYQNLYSLLNAKVVKPDLVIFLQADIDVLQERIRKRGIPYEKSISGKYLQSLCQTYNQFFFAYEETPLLTVNCSDIDIVQNDADYQDLKKEILTMRREKLQKHYVTIRGKD